MSKQRDDRPEAPEPPSTHTRPIEKLAASIDLPGPTLDALRHAGKGPPVYPLGRRLYCRIVDFHLWLDDVATGKIDATLNARKRRHIQTNGLSCERVEPKAANDTSEARRKPSSKRTARSP